MIGKIPRGKIRDLFLPLGSVIPLTSKAKEEKVAVRLLNSNVAAHT